MACFTVVTFSTSLGDIRLVIPFTLLIVAPPSDTEEVLFNYNYSSLPLMFCSTMFHRSLFSGLDLGGWKKYHQAAKS